MKSHARRSANHATPRDLATANSDTVTQLRPVRPTARAEAEAAARPVVVGSATALPDHAYDQRDLARLAAKLLPDGGRSEGMVARLFDRVGVQGRHLALPAEAYEELHGIEGKSKAWADVALVLGERAIRAALDEAGLEASDISMLMTTTVTGIAVPSLDARLMNVLPFATDLKRVPLFGLGCLGGAAGLARASEYLLAFPEEAAILLSVELCSLTLQREDASIANLISVGLFGDGAAAIVLAGARHPLAMAASSEGGTRPRVVASRSVFFPDTERVMGWDMIDTGFKIVLSSEVPAIVEKHVPEAVDSFLGAHGLSRTDIAAWVMHPGGPKVIDALERSLALPEDALRGTREGLARVGNMSSASVLFLFDEFRRERAPSKGAYGLLMAMGPAFCAELVLLRW